MQLNVRDGYLPPPVIDKGMSAGLGLPVPPAQVCCSTFGELRSTIGLCTLTEVPRAPDLPQSSAVPRLLNLGLFNCRSINEKATLLNDLIRQHHLDLLFLTETWQGRPNNASTYYEG
ncbi:hypothetical protein NFI96_009420 [Prochilodus magdalenae]|nr:hypothetical protein NFI96_009420 [Prochilodus magdalenae]